MVLWLCDKVSLLLSILNFVPIRLMTDIYFISSVSSFLLRRWKLIFPSIVFHVPYFRFEHELIKGIIKLLKEIKTNIFQRFQYSDHFYGTIMSIWKSNLLFIEFRIVACSLDIWKIEHLQAHEYFEIQKLCIYPWWLWKIIKCSMGPWNTWEHLRWPYFVILRGVIMKHEFSVEDNFASLFYNFWFFNYFCSATVEKDKGGKYDILTSTSNVAASNFEFTCRVTSIGIFFSSMS